MKRRKILGLFMILNILNIINLVIPEYKYESLKPAPLQSDSLYSE